LELVCVGVKRFLRFSGKGQDGSVPNFFKSLGENTALFITTCIVKQGYSTSCPNGRLTENVFKRISENFNPNINSNPNSNLNPKAQKSFRENEMTLFFGQVTRYRCTSPDL